MNQENLLNSFDYTRKMTIEQAQEIRNSPVWKWIVMEIDYRINLKLQEFRSCTPEKLKLLQVELSMLESLKRLPDDVVDREDTGSTDTEQSANDNVEA